MNLENSKTSDSYRTVVNLPDKMDLRGGHKRAALPDFSIYTWKKHKKTIWK